MLNMFDSIKAWAFLGSKGALASPLAGKTYYVFRLFLKIVFLLFFILTVCFLTWKILPSPEKSLRMPMDEGLSLNYINIVFLVYGILNDALFLPTLLTFFGERNDNTEYVKVTKIISEI
jgi:hypothetical protein